MSQENTRDLNAILRFSVDRQSARQLQTDLGRLDETMRRLEKQADELRKALDDANDPADVKRLTKELAAVENQIRETANAVESQLNEALDETERKLTNIRDVADGIGVIGETFAGIGAAMVAPFTLAAGQFVEFAGRADQVSADWLDNQKRMEGAMLRVGRVSAQAILPVMEKLADLAEDAATFAEQNPGAIKAVLGIGGTLVAMGGAAMTVARAAKTFADVKTGLVGLARLTGLGGAGAAAGAGGAGAAGAAGAGAAGAAGLTAGGIALAGLGGVALGGAGFQAIAKSEFGQQRGIAGLEKFAATAAFGLGKLTGGTERANRWFLQVSRSLGALDENTQSAAESALGMAQATEAATGGGGRVISGAAVETFGAFQRERTRAEERFEADRTRTVEQFAEQRSDIVANAERQRSRQIEQFERTRARTLQQFNRQDAQAEQAHFAARRQAMQRFSIETQRSEAAHQRDMTRLREDFDQRQSQAIADRNFDAFTQNQRAFETDRTRREEDFSTQMMQRDEDAARTLAEMEANFQSQREQRQQQLQQTLSDQQLAFDEQQVMQAEQQAEQLAQLSEQQAETLAAMDQAHADELTALETALAEQLIALDQNLLEENEIRNQWYAQNLTDLENWLAESSSAFSRQIFGQDGEPADVVPSLQSGGFVRSGGLANLHAGERVLNPEETRLLGMSASNQSISGGTTNTLDVNIGGPGAAGMGDAVREQVAGFIGEMIVTIRESAQVVGAA